MAKAKKKAEKTTVSSDASAEAKKQALETAILQIEKEYGKGSIMKLGSNPTMEVSAISTGSLTLDVALGIGGLPRGRIVEIYGPESSGKTTLALHCVAETQKVGGIAAYIDVENALDPLYAKNLGIDIDDMLVSQPDSAEQALDICEALVRSGAVDIIVIDSVAALVPRAEIEGQMGDSHMGLQARLMSQALRKLTGAASRSRTCIIFTNQIREKIGVMFGNPETTTGGNALKFYASIRMDIRKVTALKDNTGNATGNKVRVKVIKNKMAPPFRTAEFEINFAEGISKVGSILDVATDLGILEKRGSWFSFEGEQLGQGRDQTKALLERSPEMQQKLMDKIKEVVSSQGISLETGVNAENTAAAEENK